MKSFLIAVLMCISTSALADDWYLRCEDPWGTSDKYVQSEVADVIMDHNGTKVYLNNGELIQYSVALKCLLHKKVSK